MVYNYKNTINIMRRLRDAFECGSYVLALQSKLFCSCSGTWKYFFCDLEGRQGFKKSP